MCVCFFFTRLGSGRVVFFKRLGRLVFFSIVWGLVRFFKFQVWCVLVLLKVVRMSNDETRSGVCAFVFNCEVCAVVFLVDLRLTVPSAQVVL